MSGFFAVRRPGLRASVSTVRHLYGILSIMSTAHDGCVTAARNAKNAVLNNSLVVATLDTLDDTAATLKDTIQGLMDRAPSIDGVLSYSPIS